MYVRKRAGKYQPREVSHYSRRVCSELRFELAASALVFVKKNRSK